MERKYYLRGLGLGIVVTAVIMGMALSGQKNMTDEEVIARAKTLGMVENTENMLLSDTTEQSGAEETEKIEEAEKTEETENTEKTEQITAESAAQEEVTEESGEEKSNEEESNEEESVMEENSQADVSEGDNTEEEDSEDTQAVTSAQESDPAEQAVAETESTDNQQEVTITIVSGDSSYSVAKKLADAGIVLTAESYDAYLCANGYDKKLRTGTFAIPKTASDEQIARIVTGMENP